MITLVIICEGYTDAKAAATLQDRLLLEVIRSSRKSGNDLQSLRDYRGIERSSCFTKWINLSRKHHKTRPKFGPTAPHPDQRQTREALMQIWEAQRQGEPIDGVLLLRDRDRSEGAQRKKGMQKAISEFQGKVSGRDGEWMTHVAIGFAVPKLEAWYLAGFVPRTDRERTMLADLRREIGKDPTLHPDELKGGRHNPDARHSADKVLARLTDSDADRETDCLAVTPMDHLKERGNACGLKDFIVELEKGILPLFVASPERVDV